MQTITVAANQTLLDIALILTGDADMAYEIAKENGLLVSDRITPGDVIKYSGSVVSQPIVDYYTANNVRPATGIDDDNTANKIFDFTFDFSFE